MRMRWLCLNPNSDLNYPSGIICATSVPLFAVIVPGVQPTRIETSNVMHDSRAIDQLLCVHSAMKTLTYV